MIDQKLKLDEFLEGNKRKNSLRPMTSGSSNMSIFTDNSRMIPERLDSKEFSLKRLIVFENKLKDKKREIDLFKKQEAKRVTKHFLNMNMNQQNKELIRIITNALFGETTYQIEFYKNLKALQLTKTKDK